MARFVATLALIAAALTATGCGGHETPPRPAAASAAGERLTVHRRPIDDMKPVAAVVTTRDSGEARARIGGTLVRLNVREGDVVRKGQVLAVVADQRLNFETRAYDAEVAAAAAEAERARAALRRTQALYDKGFYAKARLEMDQAAARGADGALAAARAQRAASAELSGQGAIVAPADGRVLRADIPQGSVVNAGQTVVTVTAGDPVLRIETPESQAAALRVGDPVRLQPGDLPGAGEGVVAQVYPAVSEGRVVADVAVPGLQADLVGRRVRVQLKVGRRDAIAVPARFVSTRFGIDFVRILGPDGRAAEVAVQAAREGAGGEVEILSGLQEGDVILGPVAGPR